ncbi:hypothetical protein [Brucella suis]|uniref:hypothetical protein n=1 Tax=Brucella suis TaxID=29461 RepID=UPI003F4F78DE
MRVEHECETSALVPAFTIRAGINVVAALYVVTDVTMDAQAGFGARTTRAAAEPRRRLLMFISDLQSRIARILNSHYLSMACLFSGFVAWKNRDSVREG